MQKRIHGSAAADPLKDWTLYAAVFIGELCGNGAAVRYLQFPHAPITSARLTGGDFHPGTLCNLLACCFCMQDWPLSSNCRHAIKTHNGAAVAILTV